MSNVKTSRLPRRFDAVMKTLRELMSSNSERVRLQAVLRASEILLEHQRGEERTAIAIERAAARKAEAKTEAQAEQTDAPQTPEEAARASARAFLAGLGTTETTETGEDNAAV